MSLAVSKNFINHTQANLSIHSEKKSCGIDLILLLHINSKEIVYDDLIMLLNIFCSDVQSCNAVSLPSNSKKLT